MQTNSTNLSKSELLHFRDKITTTIDGYQDRIEYLILNENPSPQEVADARLQITHLLSIQNTLTTLISGEIFTDLQDAEARINRTTEKLKEALKKLKTPNKIIGIIASLIDLANAIINVLAGNSTIAGIAGIVNTLDSVLDNSNQEVA